MTRSHPFCSDRGTILFIVLIFVLAMSVLVLVSHRSVGGMIEFVTAEQAKLNAAARCVSGANYVFYRMMTGHKNQIEILGPARRPLAPRFFLDGSEIPVRWRDIAGEEWIARNAEAVPDDVFFTLRLQDSAGRVNFFRARKQLLPWYLQKNGIPRDRSRAVIQALLDWMDRDDLPRPYGAEQDEYLDASLPPNRAISYRDELQRVQGVDTRLYALLDGIVDFSVRNRGLNPNTMSRAALAVFPGILDTQIEKIVMGRHKAPFNRVEDLTLRSGYNFARFAPLLQFFTSDILYVTIGAPVDERREYFLNARLGYVEGRSTWEPETGRRAVRRRMDSGDAPLLGTGIHVYEWTASTGQSGDG